MQMQEALETPPVVAVVEQVQLELLETVETESRCGEQLSLVEVAAGVEEVAAPAAVDLHSTAQLQRLHQEIQELLALDLAAAAVMMAHVVAS
jgi:hypothetical protein